MRGPWLLPDFCCVFLHRQMRSPRTSAPADRGIELRDKLLHAGTSILFLCMIGQCGMFDVCRGVVLCALMHAVLERLLALVSFSEVVACFLVPVAFCLPVQASCVLIASFRLPPSF